MRSIVKMEREKLLAFINPHARTVTQMLSNRILLPRDEEVSERTIHGIE